MVSHRLRILFSGGLLCLSGLVFAQPGTDRGGAETGVWGDPEDEEDGPDRAWTWFGMGYENRAHTSVRPVDGGSEGASSTGNGVGNGDGRSRGRGKGRNR